MCKDLDIESIMIRTKDGKMYTIDNPKTAEIREDKDICEVYGGWSLYPLASIPLGSINVLTVRAYEINEWDSQHVPQSDRLKPMSFLDYLIRRQFI